MLIEKGVQIEVVTTNRHVQAGKNIAKNILHKA